MPQPQTPLREVFAGLGLAEPPDWVKNLESAARPVASAIRPRRATQVHITSHPTSPPSIPLARWWADHFGLPSAPEWMKGVPGWCILYTSRTFDDDVEEIVSAPTAPDATTNDKEQPKPPLPWGPGQKDARRDAKNAARRTAERWPARKKLRPIRYGQRRSRTVFRRQKNISNRKGQMVVLRVTCDRPFDETRRKKVAVIDQPKTKKVRTLAGETHHPVPELRPTFHRIRVGSEAEVETVLQYDLVGGKKTLLGVETVQGHDAHLAREEQREKVFGFEVTAGCKKPRWMTEEQWQGRMADPFFTYLDTDWTSALGAGNPDLRAKYSGFELG